MSILENNGFINQFFRSIGRISFLQSHFGYSLDYIPLINPQGAIVLGMVYNFLPFMVLPIYMAIFFRQKNKRTYLFPLFCLFVLLSEK